MAWTAIYHFGDLPLTLPAGAAIGAWLLAAGERRAGIRWLLAFALLLAAVGASKIAYLGWATGMPALHFKALSGHAAGFAATCPVLCRLSTRGCRPTLRRLAACAAVAATITLSASLVLARQHTTSEAAAGWLAGMAAALVTLRALSPCPGPGVRLPGATFAWPIAAFACCACFTGVVPVGYLMVKAALVLSGNRRPTPWMPNTHFTNMSDRRQACSAHPSFTYPGSGKASSTENRRTRC